MSHTVEVVHRNRFVPIPGATAVRIADNAWQIRLPVGDAIHNTVRRKPTPEAWDDAVFAIDGAETEPAMGSGIDGKHVVVTALIF